MKASIGKLILFGLGFLLQTLFIRSAQAQSKYDSIDSSIRDFMTEKKIPGFVACIVKGNAIVWSNNYGLADIQSNISMSLDAIMNIGSISKTFTATAAMQLWEKGLLDLNADINKYVDFTIRNPNYPDQPITISQILTHTSSIQDGEAYRHSYSCGDPVQSLNDWIYNNLNTNGAHYYQGSNFGRKLPKNLLMNIAKRIFLNL